MVVVAFYPADAEALGVTLALLLSDLVLLARPDVGVVIEYGGTHPIGHQPLHNGRRAWGTAGVQQHFLCLLKALGLSKYVLLRH